MSLTQIQHSISQWGRETFGEPDALAIAVRMNCEMAELLVALRNMRDAGPEAAQQMFEDAGLECADIFIMLVQVADALGVDLEKVAGVKMDINRRREWAKSANGKVQHVPKQLELNPAEVLRDVAQGVADATGLEVDHASFDAAAATLAQEYHLWKDEATGEVGVANHVKTFVEEGSGATMELDKFYILWDSGGLVLKQGFESSADALAAATAAGYGIGLVVPRFLGWEKGWEGTDGINVMKGEHLYLWWAWNSEKGQQA